MTNKYKKHILFVITRSDDIGGAHIHVRDLAIWLNKQDYKVTILVGGKGYYIDHLRSFNLEVITCSSLHREINLFNDLISIFKLSYLINKIKPDLISIHSAKSGILIRFIRLFKVIPKCIFTVHGWSFSNSNKFQKKLYMFLEWFFSSIPEKIITVCKKDLKIAEEYKIASSKKMICIHNGMPNIDNYKEKKINLKNPIRLIMTARFEPQKDHEILIESLSQIKNTNWKLTLLGKGKLKRKIYDMCKDLEIINKVEFVGWTSNVSDFLEKSDVYILTSKWEGFPRSIIEALRAGLPVIASDVGGVSESVKNNINGYLVPQSNSKKLTESLDFLLSNPYLIENFGKKSREIYLNNFQFSKMAINTEKIYQNILNKSNWINRQ